MKIVRFHTTIEADQTIRPPEGVELDPGQAEVIVLQPDLKTEGDFLPTTVPNESLATRLTQIAKEHGIQALPSDLAENHDFYAHGASKGIDES